MRLRIEMIRDADALPALSAQWWALWQRCEGTPFQSPAWLLAWWQAFAPGPLRILCLRAEAQLVGLAPFYLEQTSPARLLPLGTSLSDYFDLLIDPAFVTAGVAALNSYLESAPADWLHWEWPDLPTGALARRLSCPRRCEEERSVCEVCPVLALPDSGGLDAAVPAHCICNLRRAWHRLQRMGCARIIEAGPEAGDADIGALLESLAALSTARLRTLGIRSSLADERVRHFHALAAPALQARALLRLHALLLDNRVIAVHYLLRDRRHSFAYLSGFDPAYGAASPGSILLAYAIEQALREGAREFHFLRGGERYKYYWGATGRTTLLRVFRRRLAGRSQPAHTPATSAMTSQ